MNAPFEIIDCHIHPATGQGNHTGWWLPLGSTEGFLAPLKAAGISRACGSCVETQATRDFGATAACNREVLAFHRRCPEFFSTVHGS